MRITEAEKERSLLATSLVLSFLNLLTTTSITESEMYENMVLKANDWLLRTQHASIHLRTYLICIILILASQRRSQIGISDARVETNIKVKVVGAEQRQEFLGSFTTYKIEIQMDEHEFA